MDAAMLKNALGNQVEQTAKMENLHGVCIFAMRSF
jgi:hypothetical protein